MSTITLEVEEMQEASLLEYLKNLPYVHIKTAKKEEFAFMGIRGKYKHLRVSGESLQYENEKNKQIELL